MYPAPSARKYCKYFRGQSRRTTKYPPTKFPAAATSPRPTASAVRNVRSCPIASGTGFSLCKPSIHLGVSRNHKLLLVSSSLRNLYVLCVSALSFLRSEERRVGKECRCCWSPYH